jgi:hypothetical protein
VDADVAEHPVVEAREQSPVAAPPIPGGDAFDQANQRASENGATTGGAAGALRLRRFIGEAKRRDGLSLRCRSPSWARRP